MPDLPVARLRLPPGETTCTCREFFLYPGQKICLGRAPENDVVFNDPMISRAHAEIEWNGGGFSITDLGSINGTFVNTGRLVSSSRQLFDGDEIGLSRHLLFFELLRESSQDERAAIAAGSVEEEDPGPRLVVSAGPDQGQVFPLWGEVITIGRASRDATWEIRLTDRSVSRPHARLERNTEGCILTDLESANGTQLNGQPLTGSTELLPGDVIGLGETSLIYLP